MKVGRYEVIGTLGSGGMSKVSLARAPGGELVVLKRQHSPAEDGALLDEARVGIRLFHPNIVDHLDLFEYEGRPVLVVEYVSGATLADLKACGPLPVPMILRIGREIADALHYIHTATEEDGSELSMLHRDVTPANIIVGHDGSARLIDFGIARSKLNRMEVTQEGILKGTLRYLAPELLEGDTSIYTVTTDIWGLGMSLWESALGRYAVDGDDPKVFASIITGRSMQLNPGETLHPILRQAVAQLLSREPNCRPPTADHASLVFGQYLPQFTDVDRVCKEYVTSAVGPEVNYTPGTPMDDRHMLVNRAAATYGGPMGDWQLIGQEAQTGRLPYELSSEKDQSHDDLHSFDDMAPTVEMDLPAKMMDANFAPKPTRSKTSSAPAPVDLPSLPHGSPVLAGPPRMSLDAALSAPMDHENVNTETIDMEQIRQARANAAAAEFVEDDELEAPRTIADDGGLDPD